jgi:hypothetical protein
MHYQRIVFVHQYPVVDRFVQHLICYRAFTNAYRGRHQNPFWQVTIEAHLFAATNNWCKVFGSDRCNPMHWKQLSLNERERLAQSFREGLFQEIGLDAKHWRRYWKSMIKFRNKFVAHRELHFLDPVPHFDTALNVAYYYDKWVREIISPDILHGPSLESIARDYDHKVTPLAAKLLRATEEFIGHDSYFGFR